MEFPDHKYRQICSDATLQSAKEGFFKDFAETIIEKVGNHWIDHVFAKKTLEKEKVRICCTDENVWSAIQSVLQNIQKIYREKSAKAAKLSRLEGDQTFKLGDPKRAALLYSQSVIRSPANGSDRSIDDGLTLSLAYKSRANAFFVLKRYDDALTDLHMAIEEGYPDALKYQIYKIMGECYKNQEHFKRAKISFQVALKLLEEQILKLETTELKHGSKKGKIKDSKLKQVLEKERENISEALTLLPAEEKKLEEKSDLNPLPTLTGTPNEKYPNSSDLITVKQTAEAGRFAVASDHIDTGATLVVEKPQSACLIPDMFSSHCHHCFSKLKAPIPCKKCSGLAFCSVKCRDAAMSYHKYECEILGILIGSGMSVLSFLALRLITQEGLEFFKKLQSKIELIKINKENQKGMEFTERESEYIKVYNLTGHPELRLNEDYFRRCLMAIFLVRCLREVDFFEKKGDKLSEEEILTSSLILHHLQVLQFNAHEIYETRVSAIGETRGAKTVYIAVAIYPTVALFNHECAPAVTRYFHGKHIIIKAVRPLEKGEMISENYGPVFTKKTLYERIRELTSRYWFKCTCIACLEDWPTIDQLTDQHFRLKCKTPNCTNLFTQPTTGKKSETNPRCPRCLNKINLLEIVKRISQVQTLYTKGLEYMDNGKYEKALPLFTAFLDEIYVIGVPPCKEILLGQEGLRTCYAQTGNIWVVEP